MSVNGIYDWIQGLSGDGKNKLYIFESNARYYLGSDNGTLYDDYLLISPNTITGKNKQFSDSVSSFSSVLRNAKETFTEGKTTSFEDFPEELQLIILTTAAVGDVTSLGATRNDNDYSRITSLYGYASGPNFSIWRRIGFIFSEIIDNYNLETENPTKLTPSIVDFFNAYSNEATNVYEKDLVIKYKRIIRQQITLQNGSSYVLESSFGSSIGSLFNLQSFKNKINSEIKKVIDNYGEFIQATNVDKLILDVGITGNQFYSYYDYDKNDGSNIEVEKAKFSNLGDNNFNELFKKTPYDVNVESLKSSRIYSQGTSFDDITRANQEQFYDLQYTYEKTRPSNVDTNLKLGDVYNPVSKRNVVAGFKVPEFLPFSRTEVAATGVDEVILGFYLRFIWNLEDKIGNNNLDVTIGEIFDVEVKESSQYILEKLVNLRESIVRFELLKKINDLEEGEELEDDALAQAEGDANKNLSDLPTSELDDKELSPEDIEKRQKLYKQCALLLNAHGLKDQYRYELRQLKGKSSIHSRNYFNGRFWMVEDNINHNSVLNKLVNPKGEQAKPFLNITPDIHAALQPRLRLHKIYEARDKDGGKSIKTHEIPFESYYPKSRADGLSQGNTFDKGAGYGIKEFSFSFDGETPATAQKFIKAKLSLYFQTFNDFIKERSVILEGEQYSFRYLDLFVNTKFCPRSGLNSFSPLYYDPSFYRLRVDVGWEPRNDTAFAEILSKRGTNPKEFNKTLNTTNKTFYLNLIDHTININEDGTVTIDADYIAYMQGVLQSNSFNALTTKYARDKQKEYAKAYENLLNNNSCTPEQLDELAASINSINDKIAESLHQGVIKKLLCNEAMYNVTIEDSDINDFRSTDFFSKIPKLNSSFGTVEPDKKEATANAKNADELKKIIQSNFTQDTDYRNNKKIYFFFLADLLYVILDSLYGDDGEQIKEAENLKPILSSFSFKNPYLLEDVHLNIGEIPIDVDTFLSWYEQEIIKKDITVMPILSFIKRLLHYLIQDVFLETCINRQEHKRLVFQTTSFLAKDKSGDDPMKFDSAQLPVINVNNHYGTNLPLETGVDNSAPKKTSELYNYLFVFPHYRSAEHSGKGNPLEDENKGIYHLYIGADRGLTKKISFSKSDIQYIRESRMMQQGSNGLLQLSSVYRASVSMIGNTLFYPGMEVYINPFGFGGLEFGLPNQGPGTVDNPILSNIMGIGGYYQILRVNSKISPGSFTTDIDAHFVYSGDGRPIGRDGLKKVDLCKDIKSITKGEEGDESCRTTIISAQNVALNSDGSTASDTSANTSVDAKEEESDE